MKSFKAFSILLILGTVFLLPLRAFGQDKVTVYLDKNPQDGIAWKFSFYNNNSAHVPIDHIGLKMRTAGMHFLSAGVSDAASPDWVSNVYGPYPDSVYYDATTPLAAGMRDSTFSFSLDPIHLVYDSPILIKFSAMDSGRIIDTGIIRIIPTIFQSLSTLDSASVIATTLADGDPSFNFTIYDQNSLDVSIKALSVQLAVTGPGLSAFWTVRPSDVQAPAGWVVDSVTATYAYFHALSDGINSLQNLSGFVIGLRASMGLTHVSFIWRAFQVDTLLIDRDTISNVPITPGSGSLATSNDTVSAMNTASCGYAFTVRNDHVSNAQPPSAITEITFTSTTTGVTFESPVTETPNADWAGIISANGDTLTYLAASYGAGIPSSQVWSTFSADVHNPTGGVFTLRWVTFSNANAIDTGSLQLQCTELAKVPDVATLSNKGDCDFSLTVTNQHTPPSDIHAISLLIPAGAGSFAPSTGTSTLNWSPSEGPGNQSIRFTAVMAGTDMTPTTSQDLGFSIIPRTNGTPVPIIWQTYEAATGAVLTTDTVQATCTLVTSICDSVQIQTSDPSNCLQAMEITNRRGTGKAVVAITITPMDGWEIDSASAPIGWTSSVDPNGSSATLTSSIGIADGTLQGGFTLGFFSIGRRDTFGVQVQTTDADGKVCSVVDSLSCQSGHAGVTSEQPAQSFSMSVAPNPFSGRTEVSFALPEREHVSLVLIDVLGRVVQTVSDAWEDVGDHQVLLDGTSFAPGTYYLRLETSNARVTKKLVLTK